MKYGIPMIVPAAAERIFQKVLGVVDAVTTRLVFWQWGVVCGRGCLLEGRSFIRAHKRGDISLGKRVVFCARYSLNSVGLVNPTTLDTRGGGTISIGDYSGFSSVVISSWSSITIGAHIKCGGNVRIFDHDFHAVEWQNRRPPENRAAVRTKPIVIEDDCFIGTNAIILKGTRLGARSIVAAGSVVFGLDVPPDSLVKGNPAVVVPRHA